MELKIRNFFSAYWILLSLIILKLILQYILVNPVYELHRDEFLYLNQADHLAFGYISVPPFLALVSKIIYLLGGTEFWIRFFPALFGALTVVFVWLIAGSIGGSLLSRIMAACAVTFSTLIRINMLYQPNSFDVLAWTVIFYLLIKFVQSEKNKWLLYLSFLIAAGFYNKYNMIFLAAGLLAGVLLTSQRKIFTRHFFWKAMILAVILLLPNIIWQAANHFPVFQHMKVLKENQLDNNSSIGFLTSQLFFFFGSLPLTIAALISFFFFRSFRQYRFIGISYFVIIALFALFKAKGYYAVGIYPVIIAFGSVCFESILHGKWRYAIIPLLISINFFAFIITLKFVYPVLTPAEIRKNSAAFENMGLLRWEDGKNHNLPQDFADMLGWREMAEKSLSAYKMIPENEWGNTLIICNNYGQAGALNYYNRKRMPEAYAFNTDYIYWMPRLTKIQNIVLVGNEPAKEVIAMFKSFQLTGLVENEYAREKGTGIYLLTGANDAFTEIFYLRVEERKKKFDIF
jgi:4-amino-4-deoxy-L-arabinose transferase-like glycosyltransferase